MKTIIAASAAAILLGLATSASAGRDEVQWQQHWKAVEAKRMQSQPTGVAVAGRPGATGREGKAACAGIGRSHPKNAYNC